MPHDHALTVTLQPHSPHVQVLVVAGDLDHHTTRRLRAVLDELTLAAGDALVIDLSALTFCDSTGISILIAAHQRAQQAGAALGLAAMDSDIAHIFQIMGLDRLFSFYDTTDKAIAALR
ncbi:anti-sigma factor antagonist [Sphaerisporangium krabiense]|uniref:Anti-sigma factor antagonist n=1 Tax=Sphaerisporangium krabiense TaxID=763782 RepID=A0A7W8ZC90_9ACTN|nr:STAS domain-containing protein [Sphaerisporangium krabiense]MBB5631354.1 anti-sigma B factor antagonist [Sphaerisporangium krabiense]GII60771.1 anti-sigma factor antagonist [Sphaerisporangium krabiense]